MAAKVIRIWVRSDGEKFRRTTAVTRDRDSVSQATQTGVCNCADSGDKGKRMDSDRIERLTDKQRACLRLVYAHMSSKEIAPRLGVEPGTVDQYIKAAMRTLGVSERRGAARRLAEQEGAPRQPWVYQPLDLDTARETL